MTRDEFLRLLAEWIVLEAAQHPGSDDAEPLRAAGDRLVDDALEYVP